MKSINIFTLFLLCLSCISHADKLIKDLRISPYPMGVLAIDGHYVVPKDAEPKIIFSKVIKFSIPSESPERYMLEVRPRGIEIFADTEVGKFRALTTLNQLLKKYPDKMPSVVIVDYPRFDWRGFMLDESRFFSGKKAVLQILDSMAEHKMNRFHWHLTDTPGWRIEIKKYPKLTTIGAIGNHHDKKAPAQFYTQQEIKEIVQYAKDRHITIIPEIDMPGHAAAAMRAYPEFSGGGSKKHPNFTFNPASKETEQFLVDILTEVAALFPDSPVIHFGGDESHFGWSQWPELPEVKQLMKEQGYTKLQQVDRHFNRKMATHINKLGFKTGGWDEISSAGLPIDKTLLFWWRHDKTKELSYGLKKGFPVVLCPRIPCYFDFVQHPSHKVGRRWGGKFCPIEATYNFPAEVKEIKGYEAQIKGIQACLWTEQTPTQERRDFMTYPRLQALAEAAWTQPEQKDFKRFSNYLKPYLIELDKAKVTHASLENPYLEVIKDGSQINRQPKK